jgi:hypothetical protein
MYPYDKCMVYQITQISVILPNIEETELKCLRLSYDKVRDNWSVFACNAT